MKAFEPEAKCPKCGFDRIGVAYHDGRNARGEQHVAFVGKDRISVRGCPGCHPDAQAGEHLCRFCRQCGYLWTEAVLDRAESEGDIIFELCRNADTSDDLTRI